MCFCGSPHSRAACSLTTGGPNMRIRVSRSSVLIGFAIAVLVATAPSQILAFFRSGDPYLFTHRFFDDLLARFSGPGRLRFLIQPCVAIVLGLRDGKADFRTQSPPFLIALLNSVHSRTALRSAIRSICDLVAVAVILDALCQFLIFRNIHPGAAVLVGPILITAPYAISRTLTSSVIASWSKHQSYVARTEDTHSDCDRRAQD